MMISTSSRIPAKNGYIFFAICFVIYFVIFAIQSRVSPEIREVPPSSSGYTSVTVGGQNIYGIASSSTVLFFVSRKYVCGRPQRR